MDKKGAIPNGTANKKSKQYSTYTDIQNKRLLKALKEAKDHGMNSQQVRADLDIYCPTARITDLRKSGYHIETIRETIDTVKGKHRIARWVLMLKVKETAG